ncbi:hypothetical protein A2954_02650 [Candidatus Roizmanbacteria bacterium RIFCSPLOWO2_01_FULL_37_12]|uniref:DUF5678 domain-containing protein n=1 Tax=Candidatus Roizmanbacteria bacterium RIFCSPLOWO2_01_FULL_37_12 TaxID=1802056 RepID=A0A1F7IEZ6_9BACT|nr:MAG: hypothetical protein A2767_02175 [Candidatus Roizmanbacteria bacterium RIFCSPHIGHO2_01_FULL_35_10]OGK41924.1 MAG: hypothetical protein A2954_02650 [Candidatus Roizmanbacteria bacterium RIFCSPLOWO2_01_FULL_37_12]
MAKKTDQKILNVLLSGKHPLSKRYAGKHVLVIEDQVVPLKKGKGGTRDIEKLEKKYGRTPTLVFIPRHDVSYILILCS